LLDYLLVTLVLQFLFSNAVRCELTEATLITLVGLFHLVVLFGSLFILDKRPRPALLSGYKTMFVSDRKKEGHWL
jgi:hypothetical protein